MEKSQKSDWNFDIILQFLYNKTVYHVESILLLQYLKPYSNRKFWGSSQMFKNCCVLRWEWTEKGTKRVYVKCCISFSFWGGFASRIVAGPSSRDTEWLVGSPTHCFHSASVSSGAGAYAHPKRMQAVLERWRVIPLSCQKSDCMRFFIYWESIEAGSISRMEK